MTHATRLHLAHLLTKRPLIRVTLTLGALAAALIVGVSAANATTHNYFGYGNLTASNPPTNTCSGWPAGFACDGFNNWTWSESTWNSGHGAFILGFICQESQDAITGHSFSGNEGFGTYDELYSAYCSTHYNRTAIGHLSGGSGTYDYLQARSIT